MPALPLQFLQRMHYRGQTASATFAAQRLKAIVSSESVPEKFHFSAVPVGLCRTAVSSGP